jgi:hypothetical protein
LIPVLWTHGRGFWDQGLLDALIERTLWRPSNALAFEHRDGLHHDVLADADGAVLVVAAQHALGNIDELNSILKRLEWAVVILGGDEESVFPADAFEWHTRLALWVQTPRPGKHDRAQRRLGVFWPPFVPRILREIGHADDAKPLDWFFSGQVPDDHPPRKQLVDVLNRMKGRGFGRGEIHPTSMFGEQYERGSTPEERSAVYLRFMRAAKIAPAPTGPVVPDTFRLWEALEAGTIPIAQPSAPYGDRAEGYWPYLLGEEPPFPLLDNWNQLPAVTLSLRDGWPANANRLSAWWQQRKREMSWWLDDDITELATPARDAPTPSDLITVMMPTSPAPAHPSTEIVEETIESVRAQLPAAEIVLMLDGVRAEDEARRDDYEEYQRRLLWFTNHRWKNVLPLRFEEHHHQGLMLRRALAHVRTPLVLYVEHDTPLRGSIDWDGIARLVSSGEANVMRLHHATDIYPEHKHLMLDRHPIVVKGVPVMRTFQWSQRPHLARADWYREIATTYFGEQSRTMIEEVLHGVEIQAWRVRGMEGWNEWRVFIYTPEGNIERSYHLDGRAGGSTYPMKFAYDGPRPDGAPSPT